MALECNSGEIQLKLLEFVLRRCPNARSSKTIKIVHFEIIKKLSTVISFRIQMTGAEMEIFA